MAKSLEQVQAQIDKLQKVAAALRAKEAAVVIAQVKALIAKYQLTAADLGLGATGTPEPSKATRGVKAVKKPRAAATRSPKAAKSLNGAAVVAVSAPAAPQSAAKPSKGRKSAKATEPAKASKAQPAAVAATAKAPRKTKAAAKVLGPIKYRDEVGNEWTGRGTRPKWFLAAIASGKTADQLLAQPKG